MSAHHRICILGLGYIGLPTACMFATNGREVIGVDNNPQVIATLNQGRLHLVEDGLLEVLQAAVATGRLQVRPAPEPADAFILAVPTPFREGKQADLRAVTAAAEAIVPLLRKGNLVILESTSPPRTTVDLVAPILERSGLRCGEDFLLAYSPERVLPGQILKELRDNARVIGGVTPAAAEAARDLYATFVRGDILLTDATTAEMVKLMENTFRDINIAIANEFSRLADRLGVDVWEAIALANRHPRVKILNPGPGVGGHCISVDPWFLVEAAPDITPLVTTARRVNDTQPDFVLDLVRRALGDLAGKRISVLGLAFKPGVDDLRESPAVEIARRLGEAGAEVLAYEPYKPEAEIAGVTSAPTLEAALAGSQAILVLVRHPGFVGLDPESVLRQTPARLVIDAVDALDARAWREAGFRVRRLGDGKNVAA